MVKTRQQAKTRQQLDDNESSDSSGTSPIIRPIPVIFVKEEQSTNTGNENSASGSKSDTDESEDEDALNELENVENSNKDSENGNNLEPGSNLSEGENSESDDDPPRVQCPDCSKSYSKKANLNQHIEKCHRGLCFICPFCQQKQSSMFSHLRHLKNLHKNEQVANANENAHYDRPNEVIMTDASKNALIQRLTTENEQLQKTITELKSKVVELSRKKKTTVEDGEIGGPVSKRTRSANQNLNQTI